MLDRQLRCGGEWQFSGASGGEAAKKRRTMSASVVVACFWISFVLVAFFPASSVAARSGPGMPAPETIKYVEPALEPPPPPTPSDTLTATATEATELRAHSTERLRIAPQEADSVLSNFHRRSHGSNNNYSNRRMRRGLVGSSPPTCKAKCGSCQPCKPVHVAIGSPHGVISETEYYPEVWRCQCGNRYYMP